MATEREAPTLADIAILAISPVLIMIMVGSLVFFLVEVLYAGQYSERLLYTMFFFVIGTVLIARIAIQVDPARATLYGLALAVVTFLAMSAFVDYPANSPLQTIRPLVNLGLMALIWWSAHKLTWDCTHIDETREASDRGLLSASGISDDSGKEDPLSDEVKIAPEAQKPKGKKKKKTKTQNPSLSDWIGRWRSYRENQTKKAHTPGVWVIYFSLAALPLFAIGQSLIPPEDAARRQATFFQMFFYVGSGLGLLVTTSFLGLRRYLRQRKAKIPATLTAGWLGLGAGLIILFLVLGAFLPRPHSEVPWFGLERAGKSEREASRYAQLNDSAGKGDGAEGNEREKGKGSTSGKNGEKGSGGKSQGKSGGGKSGKQGGQNGGKDSSKDERSKDSSSDDKKDSDSKTDEGDKKEDGEEKSKDSQSRSGNNRSTKSSPPSTQLGSVMQKVAGFIKWVVIAIVIILVVIAIALGILRYLAPFTNWARNLLNMIRTWWANLFTWSSRDKNESPSGPPKPVVLRPAPFSSFTNPLNSLRDPAELVEYTFTALDSWAWDRKMGRRPAETPAEFTDRLGGDFEEMQEDLRHLAWLYSRVAYAEGDLTDDPRPVLEAVWDRLSQSASDAVFVE